MAIRRKNHGSGPAIFIKAAIEAIRKRLVLSNETIAVAESVTAGLLQLALASAEEASRFFQGGITAYNVGQKALQLDVEPIHAIASNCVSRTVASEMALNVCNRFRSHWGIAVTGYAAPVPESGNKVFAWYAIAYNGKVICTSRINGSLGATLNIQSAFVNTILRSMAALLKSRRR